MPQCSMCNQERDEKDLKTLANKYTICRDGQEMVCVGENEHGVKKYAPVCNPTLGEKIKRWTDRAGDVSLRTS